MGDWSETNTTRFTDRFSYIFCGALGILILFVVLIIIIIFVPDNSKAEALVPQRKEAAAAPKTARHCDSLLCNAASERLLASINRETDPCANFYSYTCDGWLRTHAIGNKRSGTSVLQESRASMKKNLLHVMETMSVPRHNQSQIEKLVVLYRSCLKDLSTGGDSVQEIRHYLRSRNLNWPHGSVFGDIIQLTEIILEQDIKHRMNIIFNYSIERNPMRGRIVEITPYRHNATLLTEKHLPTYKMFIEKTAALIGGNGNFRGMINSLLTFEQELSGQPHHPEAILIPWEKIDQIFKGTDSSVWIHSFKKYLPETETVNPIDLVRIKNAEYMRKYFKMIVNNARSGQTSLYIAWRIITFLACKVSFDIRSIPEITSLWTTDNCKQISSTESYCQNLVKSLMPFQWNGLLTRLILSSEGVFDVKRIFKEAKNVAEEKLMKTSWMDQSTRMKAMTKLNTMKEYLPAHFVFRGRSFDYEMYSRIPDLNSSYVDNWLAVNHALMDRTADDEDIPEDNSEITYHKTRNALDVNVDSLTPPVYLYGLPPVMNFGSLGTMILHEITHVYDSQGRLYDGLGKLNKWWSETTANHYREKESCFASQINRIVNITDDILNLFHEVIAESSGLKMAYVAYRISGSSDKNTSKTLSRLRNFSEDQLFFMSFCYRHCQTSGPTRRGQHSSGEFRCNVPVMNMAEFSIAFSCTDDDRMNPVQKCQI